MWNFPLVPPTASKEGADISLLYWAITLLAVVFGGIVLFGVIYLAVRYRADNNAVDRSNATESDLRVELAWTIIPLILALVIFGWATKLYADIYAPREGYYEVFVIGKQWMWHCQHPNGVRENNILTLPAGRLVKVSLISQDVIHAFSIPAFRVKRDAVPGRYNAMYFTPTKPGEYHLFCTEYCGTKHSEMIGKVVVLPEDEFQAWLEKGGQGLATATTSMGGGAAGGGTLTLAQQGEQTFKALGCNACHLNPNSAVKVPDITKTWGGEIKLADGRTVKGDEAYIRESILNPGAKIHAGYQNLMPPYQGQVSEEQLVQLIAYIKSLAGDSGGGK
ncbi:MAG: cytochrome c oxidase subunit 2 [Fimbriimonadales bacterium]|nr:MAG: cytochrome c oxidase subunit 2 [Fimbriimonadales bacterium]